VNTHQNGAKLKWRERWALWQLNILGHLTVFVLWLLRLGTLGQISPPVATVAVVERDGHVLALRRPDGRYTLPGGIMRYGETCKEALAREVREETGAEVEILDLIGIYSDPKQANAHYHSVKLAYHCQWLGGEPHSSYEGTPCWLPWNALPEPDAWANLSLKVLTDLHDGNQHIC